MKHLIVLQAQSRHAGLEWAPKGKYRWIDVRELGKILSRLEDK